MRKQLRVIVHEWRGPKGSVLAKSLLAGCWIILSEKVETITRHNLDVQAVFFFLFPSQSSRYRDLLCLTSAYHLNKLTAHSFVSNDSLPHLRTTDIVTQYGDSF
jgi:hypothetical protein